MMSAISSLVMWLLMVVPCYYVVDWVDETYISSAPGVGDDVLAIIALIKISMIVILPVAILIAIKRK